MPVNKYFYAALISIIVAETLSFLSFNSRMLTAFLFALILAAILFLSLKNIVYGLYIMLAELFVGGKGYLFSLNISDTVISLRIGIFIVILGVWILLLLNKKINFWAFFKKIKSCPYILAGYTLLIFSVVYGLFIGSLKNDFNNLFFDFNSWIFLLILPVGIISVNSEQADKIMSIFFASVAWLSLKTIVVLNIFSYRFAYIGSPFYKWLRNTGVGEITYISNDIFRIFFQSQIYSLAAFFIFFALFLFYVRDKNLFGREKISKNLFFITLFSILNTTTILISQSRSFWLAGLAAFIMTIAGFIYIFRLKKNLVVSVVVYTAILCVFSSIFIYLITKKTSLEIITARTSGVSARSSESSRKNQLEPLILAISKKPFFGSGFGTTLTYKSSDPRILAASPQGKYTTYAFEWGYLDIWLKTGIVGLFFYLLFVLTIILKAAEQFLIIEEEKKYLYCGLIAGLAALLIANIFTPYLNHPLGMGYIILLVWIFAADQARLSKNISA
ncbi:O-antigen ligase domain-containing protein [Candidatus Parcubacteria bacterium]|nr:MAG: O-antigen ligase domain-containing protein [Candidatus Parcubacteria bacterium]